MTYQTMKISDEHIARIRKLATASLVLSPPTNKGADLSQWCGSVFNQLQEGSCTACTTRDYLLWLQNKYGYKTVTDPDVQALYYFARKTTNDLSTDGGSTVAAAFYGSVQYGVIPSSAEAYDPSTLYVEPLLQDVVWKATKSGTYPATTDSIRSLLESGVPVGVGVGVDQQLFNPVDTPTGLMDIVSVYQEVPNEGHAVLIVGYKPDPTYQFLYRFQNSWGTEWGDKGFSWFTDAYLQKYLYQVATLDIPASLTPAPTPTPQPAPAPAPKPQPVPIPPKPLAYLNGGDVSKFQGNISWPDVAKSWSFAMIKVLDGLTPVDPNFKANYANAKASGMLRGAYQVGYPIYESAQDAYAAYKSVVLSNGGFELPPYLDLEEAGTGPCTTVQVTQWAVQWLTLAIKDYGRAIIYSNEDFFNTHIDVSKLPKGTILWVANYSNEPKLNWTFWQHTDSATIPGITTKVDTDYFKGTLDDLKALIVKEGGDMTQSKVQVNGNEFPSVVVNGDNYIHYNALKSLPGCSMKYVNNEWQITIPVSNQKPVKASVTFTYQDGSTQTL